MAVRAYNRAVDAGTVGENSIVPIVVVGPSRSGKTSLIRSLHGEKFNPSEDSTTGAKIQLSLSKVDGGEWEKNETDEHLIYNLCAANEMVKCLLTEPVNLIKDGLNNCDETDAKPHLCRCVDCVDEHENHNMMNQLNSFPEDEVTVYTLNMLQHFNAEKAMKNYLLLHTLDFAGQPVYSVTHPVFLPPRGIFLLVYNLKNDLHAQATPMVKCGAAKRTLDHHNPMTNMDDLEFWLSLIAANSTDKCCDSPVFVVCTHADKLSSQDAKQIARTILDTLTRDNFAPGRQVVHGIYLVNNTVSGSGGPEDPDVQRLKADITKKARDLPQWKETTGIPIKWLSFAKKLTSLVNVNQKKFISFEDAKTIAIDCKIADSDELQVLLRFLHELRIIIHFQEIEMIIIDTQWLLDMFSKVITVPQIEHHDGYRDEWRKLEHYGVIEVKFLEYLWSDLLGDNTPVQSIINLMEKFSLICKQQDGSYLVPAMLLNAPECHELIKDDKASPLVIRFNSSHLPFGVFPRLFVAVYKMCTSKWTDAPPPDLSKNFARFYIADDTLSLVFISDVQTITVAVVTEETSGSPVDQRESFLELCAFLVEFLRETLPKMMESFPWMKHLEFEFGIRCPICEDAAPCTKHNKMDCSRDSCAHFLSEKELLKPRCHKNPTKANVIPESSYLHWFRREDNKSAKVKEAQREFQGLCLGSEDDAVCQEVVAAVSQVSLKMISQDEVTRTAKRIADRFNLDKHSTATPPKDIIQKCRSSCRWLVANGGQVFVEALREELPSGMTGPLKIGYDVKVRDMDSKTKTLLSEALTAKEMVWGTFAKEKVGLTAHQIAYIKERIPNCVLEILDRNCGHWTMEELYDAIIDSGADAIADDFL